MLTKHRKYYFLFVDKIYGFVYAYYYYYYSQFNHEVGIKPFLTADFRKYDALIRFLSITFILCFNNRVFSHCTYISSKI